MNRLVNAFVIYQFIRLLIKPFDKTDAFKLGIIDKDGNYLKKQGDLKTAEEKKASNIFTRLVWNLKKILMKVPLVRSKLGKFATALYLVREQAEYIGADGVVIEEVLTEYFRSTNPAIVDEILSMNFDNDKYIIEDLEEIIVDELDPDNVGKLFRAALSKKSVDSTYEIAMSIIDTSDDKGSSPLWGFMNNRFDEIEEAYR